MSKAASPSRVPPRRTCPSSHLLCARLCDDGRLRCCRELDVRTARRGQARPEGADMRALVTGGAGFIGSHLVDALVDRDADVMALDDLSTGRRENLTQALAAGAQLIEADVT